MNTPTPVAQQVSLHNYNYISYYVNIFNFMIHIIIPLSQWTQHAQQVSLQIYNYTFSLSLSLSVSLYLSLSLSLSLSFDHSLDGRSIAQQVSLHVYNYTLLFLLSLLLLLLLLYIHTYIQFYHSLDGRSIAQQVSLHGSSFVTGQLFQRLCRLQDPPTYLGWSLWDCENAIPGIRS